MFNKKTRWICASQRFFNAAAEIAPETSEAGFSGALCMLSRGSVKLPKHIKRGIVRISADDYFTLYINGQFVASGPSSCYPFEQYVMELDVSEHLKSGQNLIAVQVYYDGAQSPSRVSGNNRQGFIFELEVDGVIVLTSGDRFRCLCPAGASYLREAGPTVETLDLRSYPAQWMQPKFDDSGWIKPAVKKNADYRFVPQPVEPDMYVEFNVQGDGEGIYDLEESYTAVPLIKAQGREGSLVSLYRVNEDGSGDTLLYRLYLSGNAELSFTLPQHMRKLKAVCENGAALTELGVRVVRLSENENALSLKTVSPELIGRMKNWKADLMDDRCAAFDAQSEDADEGILALARSYLSGETAHLGMQLKNMALSQSRVKTLLCGSPCSAAREDRLRSLLFVHHAWLYSLHCDDRALIEELQQAATGVIRAFSTYARRDGLLETSDESGEKRCLCTFNALYVGALIAYDRLCALLSVSSGVHSGDMIEAFNKEFFDESTGLYGIAPGEESAAQSDNLYPIYFGLKPQSAKFTGIELLKRPGSQRDEYYRLKALCLCGEYDEAQRQILSGETPSPEAAVCLFVEDILSINPEVICGRTWHNHLSSEYGNVSVRVQAFRHKALYTRQDGFVSLKL